jgi:Baseplate J-like protein
VTDFIDVTLDTDPSLIVDNGIDQLTNTLQANGFPGWSPADGNLEIILLNVLAQIAADLATSASQVTSAIFRAFGTILLGITYGQGSAATVVSTWTLADTAGHTIPGGTFVTIAQLGFYVEADVVVAPGSSTASVLLVASDTGTLYNGLSAPIATVDQIDWVLSIAATGTTSGGADPETDDNYQNRLATELTLQAPRPITADDYAAMALTVPSTVVPSGVVVGRATAIDGYDPSAHVFTGNTTNTSPTVTNVSGFTFVTVGSIITGSGIPTGATVLSINTGASTLMLNKNATATAGGTALTATGSYGNERTVTTFVTDSAGVALSSPAMADIATWLAGFREVNFLVYVVAPSYTTIYVTFTIKVLPGFDSTATVSAAESAVLDYLNPATWGSASASNGGNQWLNSGDGFNVVRYNKLLGVIEAVPGVDYVPSGSSGLALGTSASPSGTADITLLGPAPLPQSDLSTPTIIGSAI